LTLNWSKNSKIKQIYHTTDSPGHGISLGLTDLNPNKIKVDDYRKIL